jgi:hypothetical protein
MPLRPFDLLTAITIEAGTGFSQVTFCRGAGRKMAKFAYY